jgi:hypothetical protein
VTLAVLALWLAQPMLDIEGQSTCPTPAEVSEHLARLVPRSGSGRTGQEPHAYLSANKRFVNIELLGPNGELLAERRLDRGAPCADLGEAVAVILAAWQAKFRPALAPAEVSPPPSALVGSPSEIRSGRMVGFDMGIAALMSIVGGQAVLGAKLEGALFPFGIPLGVDGALSLTATHTRSFALPGVVAKWTRPALSLGPVLRLRGRTLALDVHGSAVLALLHVEGEGLQQSSSDTGAQFGLAAGLRGLWTWNLGAVWGGVDLFIYPGRDRLTAVNYGEVGTLSRLELQIALGTSIGRFK